MGSLSDFTETQIAAMNSYCDNLCYDSGNLEYEYYLVDYNYVKEKPICYCLDVNKEFLFDEDIPSSAYE